MSLVGRDHGSVQSTATRLIRGTTLLAMTVALGGCPKSEDGQKPAPSASVSTGATAVAASSAAARAEAGTADTAKPAGGSPVAAQAASYGGTYSVAPASYYIPEAKDYASVKQAKDDPSKHVGEGTLTLAVESDGRVTGTVDSGPAGPSVIDGRLFDGEIRGTVRRKEPKDQGLTGTLLGKQSGDAVEGKLSLSEANAAIVREGKFSLKKK
jgi:hypothetical protein